MGAGGRPPESTQVIPSPPRQSRRRRRHRALSPAVNSGLDLAPPLLSPSNGQWRSRSLRTRTSQPLCALQHPPPLQEEFSQLADLVVPAGTAPCDPLVAFDRYVVSATDDGRVCFYQVVPPDFREGIVSPEQKEGLEGEVARKLSTRRRPLSPIAICLCRRDARIVSMAAAPKGVSILDSACQDPAPLDFVGQVVALTSEGDGFLLDCSKQVKSSSPLTVRTVFSWNTRLCNPMCVSFRYSTDHGQWRICIGYESGCMEEWHARQSLTPQPGQIGGPSAGGAEDARPTSGASHLTDYTTTEVDSSRNTKDETSPVNLCWRGCFEAQVRSIATLGMPTAPPRRRSNGSPPDDEDDGSDVDEAEPQEDQLHLSDFLAAVIHVPHHVADERLGSHCPSSTIEVVNVVDLERDWKALHAVATKSQFMIRGDGDGGAPLVLSDYCVWPQVGMELQGSSTYPSNDVHGHGRRSLAQASIGSDKICACRGPGPCVISALSDGTIALLDASTCDHALNWGVTRDVNQIIASYPVIGLSSIELNGEPHVACCLRGGTVYVLPLISEDEAHVRPASVFLPPEEETMESADRYLHGFVAGNVTVPIGKTTTGMSSLPILVYSGGAGVLDVYSCGLMGHNDEYCVLQDLLDNKSFDLLIKLLSSMDEDDPMLQDDAFAQARTELLGAKLDPGAVGLDDLVSSELLSVRTLLMDIVRNDGLG